MSKVRIVAAVLDTRQLTLYHEDGQTTVLPQGDPRIRKILDEHTGTLAQGLVAEVSLEGANAYAAFEKNTNGLVRLFRVMTNVVEHLFSTEEEREKLAPLTIGEVPKDGSVPTEPNVEVVKAPPKTMADTVNEIMSHATPVSSPAFKEAETTKEQTMVAVVTNGDGSKTVVPGVEALKDQMAHSAKLGSTKGVEALIRRLGAVIEKWGHSVQDVLRFLERGDLPVSDRGDIVAYKILRRHPTLPDTFVDCHTGKIPQKVGSYVCVDEALVDRNRRNECSNGLHIARRGYLGNFPGDVCVLTVIAPEDVVTVPHGDANKVRVCGYHIVGLIPSDDFDRLRRNQPIQNDKTKALLAQAIAGKHVARLQQVRVTAQKGASFEITDAKKGELPRVNTSLAGKKALAAAPKATAIDDPTHKVGAVDPKAVNQSVKAIKAGEGPRQVRAKELAAIVEDLKALPHERVKAARDLVAHKKAAKISYLALGLTQGQISTLDYVLEQGDSLKAPAPKAAVIPMPKLDKPPPKGANAISSKAVKVMAISAPKTEGLGPRQIKARDLAAQMRDKGKNRAYRVQAATYLQAHKKASKISWTALGLDEAIINEIKALLG